MKLGKALALAAVIALAGCTNDYDQFNVVGEGGAIHPDSSQTGGNMTGGSGGQGGEGGSGGSVGGDASGEAGRAMPDSSIDVVEEDAHAGDAPPDAPSVSDVAVEADAVADVSHDVTPDVVRDAADAADASDVVLPPDVSDGGVPDVPDVTVSDVPDVSIIDAQDADVSVGPETGSDAPPEAPCAPNEKLCGGTCVLLDDPTHGCAAASCSPCPTAPHTTGAACASGACAIAACMPTFADCDGVASNGCEVSLLTDVDNCGDCRRPCSTASVASRQCVAGVCVPSCTLNSASCQAPAAPAPDDGCERLVTTAASCGGCDNNCAAQGSLPGLSCISAVCQCVTNAVCGGIAGACNASNRCVCNGVVCQAGEACITEGAATDGGADAGEDAGEDANPDEASADAEEDAGTEAAAPGIDRCACNGGSTCSPGETCCQTPAGCINLATDPMNCGACGRRCAPGLGCSGGVCRCATDDNCNAGSAGTCLPAQGQCMCSPRVGGVCDPGRRCQADGSCG